MKIEAHPHARLAVVAAIMEELDGILTMFPVPTIMDNDDVLIAAVGITPARRDILLHEARGYYVAARESVSALADAILDGDTIAESRAITSLTQRQNAASNVEVQLLQDRDHDAEECAHYLAIIAANLSAMLAERGDRLKSKARRKAEATVREIIEIDQGFASGRPIRYGDLQSVIEAGDAIVTRFRDCLR